MDELRRLETASTPTTMLSCITAMIRSIYDTVEEEGEGRIVVGADDLMPVVIYVLCQSQLPALGARLSYIEKLCDQSLIFSEEGYFFNTVAAALSFLLKLEPPPAADEAAKNLLGRFSELIEEKRRRPGEDLISALVEAELDGRKLTHTEILGFCFLLISGGNETTEKLIANTVHQLARHPDQRARLLADPSRIPAAVEESLRFRSPTQYMVRAATHDVHLHGATIPAGEKAVLLIGAANHDPRRFDAPEQFDIERSIERHLAFGFGVHFCLGARLARLEARVALEEIHRRLPDYEVDEAGVGVVHAGNVAGLATLPVRFTPSRRSGAAP